MTIGVFRQLRREVAALRLRGAKGRTAADAMEYTLERVEKHIEQTINRRILMAIKKVKRIRDISLCLVLAKQIRDHAEDGEYSPELNTLLVDKLEALDARKGGREKGQGAALTPVASVAKKAARRR